MKECKIVQDLLPSYIEKLTSKDTNEYVEGHLKTCDNCTSVYNDMKAEIKVNTTSPKAEIDYMKKVRKKMRIAEKLLYIILLLFIIFVLVFWREIFSFICYTDICNRYLKYQEEVFETGKYTVRQTTDNSITETYRTRELAVNKNKLRGNEVTHYTAILKNSDFPGTTKHIRNIYKGEEDKLESTVITYMKLFEQEFDDFATPFYPYFNFDRKFTFWELMSSFNEIRNIRIVDGKYEIDFKEGRDKAYLYRGEALMLEMYQDRYTLKIGEISEEDINKALAESENAILLDYESSARNITEEISTKLSNCEQEEGTIVAYDFQIPKQESSSLKYLSDAYNFDNLSSEQPTSIDNIKQIRVTNNVTYKKFQERWSGLRDLTDEDFINYTAIIIVDTDNSKELHYKDMEFKNDISFFDIYMTETEAKTEYQYSANLLIVPNTMLYSNKNDNNSVGYFIHIINN